jgi:hypothetical protein
VDCESRVGTHGNAVYRRWRLLAAPPTTVIIAPGTAISVGGVFQGPKVVSTASSNPRTGKGDLSLY